MRVIVLIKQILDPAGITVRPDKERIFVNVEMHIIDPGDKNALEAALQVKDAAPETEVIAICMGPPHADDALREALAMGADAAYLLSDAAFEPADASVTARVLAAAIERIGADLVLAGAGQIGPRVAELLKAAQISDGRSLIVENGRVRVKRRWGSGYAVVEAPLPALVTVAPGVNRPRYAHGARIMNAYREWETPVWGAAELGLTETDLSPLLSLRGQSFPAPSLLGELIHGDPAEVAAELASLLRVQKAV